MPFIREGWGRLYCSRNLSGSLIARPSLIGVWRARLYAAAALSLIV